MRLLALPLALFSVSVLDLVNTAVGIHLGIIVERNPIVLAALHLGGIPLLVVGKLFVTVLGISIIEFLWRTKKIRESVAEYVYLVTILLYVGLYTIITLIVNFA